MGEAAIQIAEETRQDREAGYKALALSFKSVDSIGYRNAARELVLSDLYFLLTVICGRQDMREDWLFDRCNEVQADPNSFLDLWAREHYKSTIITFGLTLQDILKDANETIGIFSHTRPIAKGFLIQIRQELQSNELLKGLFGPNANFEMYGPDEKAIEDGIAKKDYYILYANPKTEAERWSIDGGIVVRRSANPKEATVEAHGLVDGQPTSRHFSKLVYDDVVTLESVSTPEMMTKVTNAWALSLNLGSRGGAERYIGTRYHHNDTYKTIMDRGTAIPRIYAATEDGTENGKPVLLDLETLRKKRRDMGPYVFGSQMLQNPTADKAQGFKTEWLKYWKAQDISKLNLYLLCDPASKKKKSSDYTAMAIVGLGPDLNTYIVKMIRDRMNLTERARMLLYLHREYQPVAVGYEQYGKDSDIEHIEFIQDQENYRFVITPLGGSMSKEDRIRRLVPDCEQGRLYLPAQCMQTNYEGKTEDLTKLFVNDEYEPFPVGLHDDMFDCIARIKDKDLGAVYPKAVIKRPKLRQRNARVV